MMNMLSSLQVDEHSSGWWVCWPDGEKWLGPYRRSQDAKGQLTKIKRYHVKEPYVPNANG